MQKNQGKELTKILGTQEYEIKIKILNEQLKQSKERIEELEKKKSINSDNSKKFHEYFDNLQVKYKKLLDEVNVIRKSKINNGPENETKTVANDKKDVEELQFAIDTLRKTIESEKQVAMKTIKTLKDKLNKMRDQLKESDQTNRLNALKLKELARALKPKPPKSPMEESGKEESKSKTDIKIAAARRKRQAITLRKANLVSVSVYPKSFF